MTSSADIQKFILGVPQIVPESRCFECRICCRFPDTEEVQIPYWSETEAAWVRDKDKAGTWFKPVPGTVSLEPKLVRCAEAGYRCPAFEDETRRCTIHSLKPLDCRLYPFVVARHPSSDERVLVMDTKCPYIQEHTGDPELAAYAAHLADYLSTPVAAAYLETNPKLAGPFWPEYASVASLPGLSGERTPPAAEDPPHPALKPWSMELKGELLAALRLCPHDFSGYTAASLLGWGDLIPVWWASIRGAFCLFSGRAGSLFMPLPPLAGRMDAGMLHEAWEILKTANQGGATSRIEGVEPSRMEPFEEAGFTMKPGESEYLYSTRDLIRLSGDRYRSQRGSINRLKKEWAGRELRIRPFHGSDAAECLRLYTRWAIRKQSRTEDRYERALVRDGLFFHRRLMLDAGALGLVGQVAEAGGRVVGYTLGGAVSDRVFCVFLEIAEPEMPGVSQFLFREFCRTQEAAPEINAMGDSGLPGLHQAKMGYHPSGFARVYTATA